MDEAVLDVELGTGGESGLETTQPDPQAQRQSDKEYSQWIKSLREDGDAGKHYRRIKDDFGRLEAIRKLDPKGIDGIRSTYDGIKGLAYGDKTGLEAANTMRSALAETQSAMDSIRAGEYESLPEDVRDGIIRTLPAQLETLAQTNPDAYTAALLPHFVDSLRESGLVQHFNQLVDVLSQKPPAWLKPEQMTEWTNERLRQVLGSATGMSQWFREQEARAKEVGAKPGGQPMKTGGEPTARAAETGGTANPQYWQEKIYPEANKHAEDTFNRELRPWEEKLAAKGFRLSKLEKEALAQKFVSGVTALAQANKDYTSQMSRYDKMKNPDAASIVSVFRGEFNRHANNVMKQLVEENYADKLKGGKPGPKVVPHRSAAASAPERGVQYGSVKPRREDIDLVKTPKDWLYDETRFRRVLKNGRTFELRA